MQISTFLALYGIWYLQNGIPWGKTRMCFILGYSKTEKLPLHKSQMLTSEYEDAIADCCQ